MNEDERQLLERGMAAARAGDREQARRLFGELSEQNPNLAEVWLYLGILVETPERSAEYFYRALGVEPNNELARRGMEWALSWLSKGAQPALPLELQHLAPWVGAARGDIRGLADVPSEGWGPEPPQEVAPPWPGGDAGFDPVLRDRLAAREGGAYEAEPEPDLGEPPPRTGGGRASLWRGEIAGPARGEPVAEAGEIGVSEAEAPPEEFLAQGRAHLDAGRFGEAALAFRAAAAAHPKDVEAHGLLAVALYHLGLREEAFGGFYLVTELQPDSAEAYANLGFLFAEQHHLEAAEAAFRTALSHNDALVEVHIGLADVLHDLGRADEAVAEWKLAATLRPDLPEVYTRLAEVYASRGQLEEAVEEYRQVVEQRPSDAEAHLKYGEMLFRLGRTEAAVGQFQAAAELEESLAAAHFGLGWALRDLGRREEAIASLTRAIHLEPDYAEQCLRLVSPSQPKPAPAEPEAKRERTSAWGIFGRGRR